jgi:hypothetical protein
MSDTATVVLTMFKPTHHLLDRASAGMTKRVEPQ